MSEPMERHQAERNDALEVLGELRDHARRIGARTLASRLERDLCHRLELDRFQLVVVGEFNQGKTSLVNALLGRALLPVGATPTTAIIHHVEYAEEPTAKLVFADGAEQPLPLAELERLALNASAAPSGELSHAVVGYPSELLRERIVLVDTPGVNDLSLQRTDVTYQYIPNADAVLFVLDAGQLLTESERIFLRDQLLARSRDKIVFVVAKADIWTEAERDEALDYVRSELGRLVPAPTLFAVSPQLALAGRVADSGVPELERHLRTFLAEERGRIMLDNVLGEALTGVKAIARALDACKRAAYMTAEEIARRVAAIEKDLSSHAETITERRAAIREEVAAIRASTRRDVERFCADMVAGLGPVVDSESVEDLRLYLPGFLGATFVQWAEQQSREVATALEQLAERTVVLLREDAHDAAKRLSAAVGDDVPTPDLAVDTFGYDVGVFALFTLGLGMFFSNALVGGMLAVAAPVLAIYLRGRVELETRERAREQAEVAVREAAAKLTPKLDTLVESFADRLEAWVLTAGEEIHRELLDVLAAAQEARAVATPNVARDVAECEEREQGLGALRDRLESLRSRLLATDASASDSAEPAPA